MPVEDPEDLLFSDDDDVASPVCRSSAAPWKILIVDDDIEVHSVTRLAIQDIAYAGRGVSCLSAFSGAQAVDIMATEKDIAVVLLDVVMETEDAGLQAVRSIRDELGNRRTRIILRTGQPGQAPERDVVLHYDINDYKSKTELTAQQLFTAIIAALRSYADITTIENSRTGLEHILHASTSLFEKRSLEQFIEGVLMELKSMIGQARGILLCKVVAKAGGRRLDFRAMTADGDLTIDRGVPIDTVLPSDVCEDIETAYRSQCNLYREEHCVIVFRSLYHVGTVIYMRGHASLDEADRRLLEVFCSTLAIGFDNAALYEQLANAQKATVLALADLAEFRDEDTGDHVRRIERLTTLITQELCRAGLFSDEIDELFTRQIGLASILHDVGKIAIPDAILHKPAKLDAAEWQVMRTHAGLGGLIMAKAATLVEGRTYLSMAAEIAAAHHEKFDGSGYPLGLRREEIPLSARITAVADVFDALVSRRPYKEPWPVEKALANMRDQAGTHFDPVVVNALVAVVASGILAATAVD